MEGQHVVEIYSKMRHLKSRLEKYSGGACPGPPLPYIAAAKRSEVSEMRPPPFLKIPDPPLSSSVSAVVAAGMYAPQRLEIQQAVATYSSQ